MSFPVFLRPIVCPYLLATAHGHHKQQMHENGHVDPKAWQLLARQGMALFFHRTRHLMLVRFSHIVLEYFPKMSANEDILDTLSTCFLHNGTGRDKTLDSTFSHRIQLCRAWGVGDEAPLQVLDVGCGQGESTAVLACFVGKTGHVTGLDPAEPSYGAPFTLQQSQNYLAESPLGKRVSFVRDNLPDYLDSGKCRAFDAAVFCHSLWYFSNRDLIRAQFAALARAGFARVFLAEYTFASEALERRPHQLAARAQMQLHAFKKQESGGMRSGEPNVRGALEVDELLKVAQSAGWSVARRGCVSPPEEMRDGYWEAKIVTSSSFKEGVLSQGLSTAQEESVLAFIPQVEQAMEQLHSVGGRVATMDVAWAVLGTQKV